LIERVRLFPTRRLGFSQRASGFLFPPTKDIAEYGGAFQMSLRRKTASGIVVWDGNFLTIHIAGRPSFSETSN
jgi:hypothetical protein